MFGKKKLGNLKIYKVEENFEKKSSKPIFNSGEVKSFFGHVGSGLKQGYKKFEKVRTNEKIKSRVMSMNENFSEMIGDLDIREKKRR